jgi:ABC-type multidrug transport system fused ATPase/permease subunit
MATTPELLATATPDAPAAPVVVFDHVSIGFEGKQVLQDISLTG